MVSYEDEVYIGNTLKYIQLLIEKDKKKRVSNNVTKI